MALSAIAIGAIVSSIAAALSAGISGGVTASVNKRNRKSQENINATNIANAKAQLDQQLAAAKEDREFNADYNSEGSQFKRMLSVGMSPSLARQSLAGSTGMYSSLGQVDTSLPDAVGSTDQVPDMSALSGIGYDGSTVAQIKFQQEENEKQRQHDLDMLKHQQEFELEKSDLDMIFEMYSRGEVREAQKDVSSVWSDIVKLARDKNFELSGVDRMTLEEFLSKENRNLLDRLDQVSQNACANDLINARVERYQNMKTNKVGIENTEANTDLTKAQKSLQETSEKQIKQEMRYYPKLMDLELAAKRLQNNMTEEQLEQLKMQGGEYLKKLLAAELNIKFDEQYQKQIESELLRVQRDKERLKRGDNPNFDSFTNFVFSGAYNVGAFIENLGSVLGGSALGLVRRL